MLLVFLVLLGLLLLPGLDSQGGANGAWLDLSSWKSRNSPGSFPGCLFDLFELFGFAVPGTCNMLAGDEQGSFSLSSCAKALNPSNCSF